MEAHENLADVRATRIRTRATRTRTIATRTKIKMRIGTRTRIVNKFDLL